MSLSSLTFKLRIMIDNKNSYPSRASLLAQMVKHLPTMWETWVQTLGPEGLLEKEMATHSSILAWKIPWTEEPGRLYSPWGHKEFDTTGAT